MAVAGCRAEYARVRTNARRGLASSAHLAFCPSKPNLLPTGLLGSSKPLHATLHQTQRLEDEGNGPTFPNLKCLLVTPAARIVLKSLGGKA